MPKTLGDLSGVSDGWLNEFLGKSRDEMADPKTKPARREFAEMSQPASRPLAA